VTVRALLFDFDGLICDTEHAAFRSWEEVYAGFGLAFPTWVWARMSGRSDGETIAVTDLSERVGRPLDADVLGARLARKHALCDREPLRPGVATLLHGAMEQGMVLSVVSSSARSWVERHLVRLGVFGYPQTLATGDEVAHHKPAPDLYLAALQRLNVPAHEAVALEDSVMGVRAARAAGLRCIAVPNAVGDRVHLRDADAVVDTLEAISVSVESLSLEGAPWR
jgi:HAD superfamily hydrolase (TIGR01509 family)